jgi:hypothetical protein
MTLFIRSQYTLWIESPSCFQEALNSFFNCPEEPENKPKYINIDGFEVEIQRNLINEYMCKYKSHNGEELYVRMKYM